MTFPNEVTNMPTYIIYRDSPIGQPFDGTAPLAFLPPKDSDELFDALRAEFPHLKTHSERMREATIAYLMQERMGEQSPASITTPLTAETTMTSPWLTSFPSMTTDSTFSSPDMLGLATPSFNNSPQSQHAQPHVSRQSSVTGSVAPNTTTPPALENMTGVFSLSDSTQPKQRIRRKMTETEKAEYRKRRIVKACDKCSKRKRKCNHNQGEIESLPKATQKVEKTKPVAHHKKASVIPMSLSPDPAPDNISAAQPFIQNDDWFDFTLLDDPLPEMSFDDLLQSDLDRPLERQQYIRNQFSWGADEDFSMMFRNDSPLQSTPSGVLAEHDPEMMQQGLLFDHLLADRNTPGFTTGNKKYPVSVQPPQYSWGGSDGNGFHDLDTQQLLDQQPRQRSRGGANGNGMLWEGLGTDQQAIGNPMLQRTAHNDTQTVESGDALIFRDHFGDSVDGPSSYSGATAPREELTRNIKNPKRIDVLHDLPDGDDRHVHQSESTSKNRNDRFAQANHQNRANVRSVEGSGTKDLLQAATVPQNGARMPDLRATSGGRTIDPSSELYRLRLRAGDATPLLQTKPRTLQTVSRADSQVNGGAYLRLDTGTPNLTGLSAILPAMSASAEKPAHTRARNPTASNSSSDSDSRSDNSTHFEGAGADSAAHSSRPRAHGRSQLREVATAQSVSNTSTHFEGASAMAAHSSRPRAHDRSHDTVRYRDHFGRVALAVCTAVLGSLLLFCASQQKSSLSLSMVLLALLAPSSSSSTRQWRREKLQHYEYMGADAANSVVCEDNVKATICRKTRDTRGALCGNGSAKTRGWVMTPHSSIRWSVGLDWTACCG